MALLDWISPDNDLRLVGQGVRLRPHRAADYGEWSALRARSQAFLQPWEPTWPTDDLSRTAYRRRLSAYAQDIDRGVAYPFLVFRADDGALVGGVTLSNIRRGVAQMGTLGYWVGQGFARRGHTLAAVRTVSDFAFKRLGLHRLEAACVPDNIPSQGVLAQAGFQPEGRASAYLRIDGVWRDHLLFGLLSGVSGPPGLSR